MAFLTENLGPKIVALLVALVVYAHVTTDREQETTLRVPLRIAGLDPALRLGAGYPESIELNARGSGKQLLKLRLDRPELVVSLSGVGPGQVQRMLSPSDVRLPVDSGITVTRVVDPAVITFEVDTLVTRSLEVRVPLIGDLGDAVALAGPIAPNPDTVLVTGPSAGLDTLLWISASPLDLGALSEAGDVDLELLPPPGEYRLGAAHVLVQVPLVQVITRIVRGVPVRVEGLRPGLTATADPDTVAVELAGPEPLLADFPAGAVHLRVNAAPLAEGRHLLTPEVDLSRPELRVLAVQPARILLEIGPPSDVRTRP